jgi:hypothetical protein
MINCEVSENRMGHLTVSFNGKSLYLQTDYDRAAFVVACGAVKAPDNWDGQPSSLPDKWWETDFESVIDECPEEYEEQAEYEKTVK